MKHFLRFQVDLFHPLHVTFTVLTFSSDCNRRLTKIRETCTIIGILSLQIKKYLNGFIPQKIDVPKFVQLFQCYMIIVRQFYIRSDERLIILFIYKNITQFTMHV